jgi:hypothetical protein
MKEQTWDQWLRAVAKEGRHVSWKPDMLGALTGQDFRALAAIAKCWELYACSDDVGAKAALSAVRALLPAMQPQCRFFAKELIARSLDWKDRDRLWRVVSEGS